MKERQTLTPELILRYLLCLILSSFLLDWIIIILLRDGDISLYGLLGFIFIFVCTFITYLICAVPIQILLNRYRKKFNIIFFAIYLIFSCIFTYILTRLSNPPDINPLFISNFYVIAFISALLFWFWDSIFLQK